MKKENDSLELGQRTLQKKQNKTTQALSTKVVVFRYKGKRNILEESISTYA